MPSFLFVLIFRKFIPFIIGGMPNTHTPYNRLNKKKEESKFFLKKLRDESNL